MKPFSYKKTVSQTVFAYFTAILITMIFQLFTKSFFQKLDISPWLFTTLPLYLLGFPIAYLILRKVPDSEQTPEKTNMPIKQFIKLFLIGYTFMYIGNLISMVISSLIASFTGKVLLNPIAEAVASANIFTTFLYTVILAPLGEEYFFRFLTYKKLSKYGDKIYILLSSLLFAVFHLNVFQIIYAFLMGTILGYMYAKTRNMKYNVSMHMIVNFIGAIVANYVQYSEIATTIFGIIVIVVVILGFILLIKNFKKAEYSPASDKYSDKPMKDTFLNIGMISFLILFIIDNILSIISA